MIDEIGDDSAAQLSASKKRKIKKKAKQLAEQLKQKQMEEASQSEAMIEAANDIEDLDLPAEVLKNYRKLKPNVSEIWLKRLRRKLQKDTNFK